MISVPNYHVTQPPPKHSRLQFSESHIQEQDTKEGDQDQVHLIADLEVEHEETCRN